MRLWTAFFGSSLAVAGCVAAEKPAASNVDSNAATYAGWYMEHAGQTTFQACGKAQAWRITQSADLPARAKAFGLDQDTPVYVRVSGSVDGSDIAVTKVEQFGSPTPVRNCALNGVVIPAPSKDR